MRRLLLLAFLAPLAVRAQSPAPFPAADSAATAFVDVSVVPMDRERVLAHQTVVVRGGRIESIAPAASAKVPAGARRIDGAGKWLVPGLADMHAHAQPGAGDAADGAGRQIALYLANGITTVRSLGGPSSALAVRERIRSGALLGPRLYLAGPSVNGKSAATPADAARMVSDAKRAGFDLIKTHGMFPTGEFYDSLAAAARREGMPLVGHVTPEFGLARALDAGQEVEHLDGWIAATVRPGAEVPPGQLVVDVAALAAVDTLRSAALARDLARRHLWSGPTLGLFESLVAMTPSDSLALRPEMRFVPAAGLAAWKRQQDELLGAPFTPEARAAFVRTRRLFVRQLHDAGAGILAGSDSPMPFHPVGFALHRELEAFSAAGLSPYAVLETATRSPAEYMGKSREWGTLAPGLSADAVLLDADPMADVRNLQRIRGVMVRGRWLDRAALDTMLDGVAASASAMK